MELQSALMISSDERNIASCVAESAQSGPTASDAEKRSRRSEKRKRQAAADSVHGDGVRRSSLLAHLASKATEEVASGAIPPDVVNKGCEASMVDLSNASGIHTVLRLLRTFMLTAREFGVLIAGCMHEGETPGCRKRHPCHRYTKTPSPWHPNGAASSVFRCGVKFLSRQRLQLGLSGHIWTTLRSRKTPQLHKVPHLIVSECAFMKSVFIGYGHSSWWYSASPRDRTTTREPENSSKMKSAKVWITLQFYEKF